MLSGFYGNSKQFSITVDTVAIFEHLNVASTLIMELFQSCVFTRMFRGIGTFSEAFTLLKISYCLASNKESTLKN